MRRYRVKYCRWREEFGWKPYIPEYTDAWFSGWDRLLSGNGSWDSDGFATLEEAKDFIRRQKEVYKFNKKRNKEMEDVYFKP